MPGFAVWCDHTTLLDRDASGWFAPMTMRGRYPPIGWSGSMATVPKVHLQWVGRPDG